MKKGLILGLIFAVALLVMLSGCSENLVGEAKGGKPGKPSEPKAECNDKKDNDGDGFIDLKDAGCSDRKDIDESNCGDSTCEGDETCSSCAQDCGDCPPVCGDGIIDENEQCDGSNWGMITGCTDFGNFTGGELACSQCYFDTSGCISEYCGDAVCSPSEDPVSCPEDCSYPDSCEDSDGGFVVPVQGTVEGYSDGTGYAKTDYCIDTSMLMEYHCIGPQWNGVEYDCGLNSTGYCLDAKCVFT